MSAIVAPTTHNIQLASKLLKQGHLVALPTETVYGLAADASQPHAIQQIFQVKQRPHNHPLIVHLHSISQIDDWAINIPDITYQLAEQFWPGPLTLILPKHPQVSSYVTGGQQTIALRLPNQSITQQVLKNHNLAVVAPSANLHCHISPTKAEHVEPLRSQIDLILDGGDCHVGVESTIIDLTCVTPTLRRLGVITEEQLKPITAIDTTALHDKSHATPGNLARHYAPNKPTYLIQPHELERHIKQSINDPYIVMLAQRPQPHNWQGKWYVMPQEPQAYARNLYAQLHEAERQTVKTILIEKPAYYKGLWNTIHDRLSKACQRPPKDF